MEEILLPLMYDIPDREDLTKVRITAAAVRGESEPEFEQTAA